MDAQLLTSGIIFGLSIGSIFFLMAIGLSLCFGLMRIISLDQMLYYSIGGYITYSLSLGTGSVWLGVLGGLVVSGIAAFVVERLIFRRIYERELTFSMITSFGILIGGIGIMIFLNRTITGKAIRAGIEDVEHVEGLGINVSRLFTITFIIAGTLSGLAGGLHAPLIMVDPSMGLEVLAFVFMVVIIGGLGSIKGTLVSAFIVGQVVSLGSLIYAPLAQMAPFAIMLLILLIKPTGLYGSKLLKR